MKWRRSTGPVQVCKKDVCKKDLNFRGSLRYNLLYYSYTIIKNAIQRLIDKQEEEVT